MKKIICTLTLGLLAVGAANATFVADLAGDYVDDATLAEGWGYFYSDAASGGTEVALNPNVAIGQDGQTGFGGSISYGVPALDGSNDNGGNFQLFNNSNPNQHNAVEGTHVLMHAGQQGNNADYIIARYTLSVADISENGTTASIETLFQSFDDGGGDTGTDFLVFHNSTMLLDVNSTDFTSPAGEGDFTGVNALSSFTIGAGDTISFVVGNAGNFGGSETAVFGQVNVIPEPATLGLIALFGGGMLFVRRGLAL
ncbi:PEP-CTERM sorting domain-containing protein [Pontiellaceae bacterium B1224]|nr:PEP-CTERM sorting domain-containing protein [Pontiellaceae bacterium B1224]